MICTVCWGKGWTRGDGGEKVTCPACHGSGKVEQTNEEWFCTLSTEEKAEWIAKQKCDGCNDEPYDDKHGTCKYCMAKKTEQIMEWLKEKHHAE